MYYKVGPRYWMKYAPDNFEHYKTRLSLHYLAAFWLMQNAFDMIRMKISSIKTKSRGIYTDYFDTIRISGFWVVTRSTLLDFKDTLEKIQLFVLTDSTAPTK